MKAAAIHERGAPKLPFFRLAEIEKASHSLSARYALKARSPLLGK
jgi:hypothetical protein